MGKLRKVKGYIQEPSRVIHYIASKGFFHWMADEQYLKMMYRLNMKKPLDLDTPQTFNEKLQWLKLYNRKPEYTSLVDKLLVRDYVSAKIGQEYLIPLLGVWEDPDEIDFDSLPDQFVLKCNHNSGLGMCICKEKSKLDVRKARQELRKGLKQNYYLTMREWPYKNVAPKIIAEKHMVDESGYGLKDYKLHCFNGEPRVTLVCSNRFSGGGLCEDFFDNDWKHLQLKRPKVPNFDGEIKRPASFEEMKRLAKILAQGLPFARIDFYEVDGKIYFGEITFFPASGMKKFGPESWDGIMGRWLKLPEKCCNE